MKIDVPGIQAFVAIVDHGTFQKAGEFLNISQTGLTRRLQGLETQLGVRLIDRSTRRWTLTAMGQEFLPKARRLIHELESAILDVRAAKEHSRGPVTIASVATMALNFLPAILLAYARRYESNRVKLIDSVGPEVTEAVLQRRAEFGINVLTRLHQDLESFTLMHDPFVLMCRDDDPLSRRKRIRWSELKNHPVILLGYGSGNGVILDYALKELKVELSGRFEAQKPSTALGLVASGAGIVILPRLTLRKDAYPRVCAVPLVDPTLRRELGLIKRKDATLSPAAGALYQMIVDAFQRDRPRLQSAC
jgi:DNA-binding transcriptional LysR family regulator